jgi:hypothetical protein
MCVFVSWGYENSRKKGFPIGDRLPRNKNKQPNQTVIGLAASTSKSWFQSKRDRGRILVLLYVPCPDYVSTTQGQVALCVRSGIGSWKVMAIVFSRKARRWYEMLSPRGGNSIRFIYWKRYSHHFQSKEGRIAERTLLSILWSTWTIQRTIPLRKLRKNLDATRFNKSAPRLSTRFQPTWFLVIQTFERQTQGTLTINGEAYYWGYYRYLGFSHFWRAPKRLRRMNSKINLGHCREGWALH